jgi:hypothetical protein
MLRSLPRFWIIGVILILGCNLSASPAAQTPATTSGGPKTFFDEPAANTTVPMGPLRVVVHAEDSHGVSRAEFSVNGKLVSTQESPDPKQNRVSFTFAWEPSAEGDYLLQARAQNALGAWGQDIIIPIQITKKSRPGGSGNTPEEPEKATLTPTAGATSTATPSPTPTLTLTPTSEAITFTPDVNPKQFYTLATGCDPKDLILQVKTTGGVYSVNVFFKLFDAATSAPLSEWDGGNTMTPIGGGSFYLKVNSTRYPPHLPFTSAFASYQFVASNNSGAVLARSPVYSDVILKSVCP